MRTSFAVLVLIFAAACASAESPCGNEPEGRVVAFFGGGEPSQDIVAEVLEMTLADGLFRYRLRAGEPETLLTWRAPEALPGIETGATYRFQIDYSMGSPDSSGIVIHQGDQLLFAALTDQRPGEHVLKSGIPGFEIEVLPPACPSRGRTECHDSMTNLPVLIRHGGQSITLHQGERAPLGEFDVHLLTAQSVTYSNRCADAGLDGISVTVARRK